MVSGPQTGPRPSATRAVGIAAAAISIALIPSCRLHVPEIKGVPRHNTSGTVCQPADGTVGASLLYEHRGVANVAVAPRERTSARLVCPLAVYAHEEASKVYINEIRVDYDDKSTSSVFSCTPWRTKVDGSVAPSDVRYTCSSDKAGCTAPTYDSQGPGSLVWREPFGWVPTLDYQQLVVICELPSSHPDPSWIHSVGADVAVDE